MGRPGQTQFMGSGPVRLVVFGPIQALAHKQTHTHTHTLTHTHMLSHTHIHIDTNTNR